MQIPSTMEGKVDENKSDLKCSAVNNRPVRNRKQRSFDDFVLSQWQGPLTSSTPIKRNNSRDSESPVTDVNLKFDQSLLLDINNSTREASHNQGPHETVTELSHSQVKYVGKRHFSEMVSPEVSSSSMKRKRGRPCKITPASQNTTPECFAEEESDPHICDTGKRLETSVNAESFIPNIGTFAPSGAKRRRGRPKRYSPTHTADVPKGNSNISSIDTSRTRGFDVLMTDEDVSNSSLHEVNEEKCDDANKSSDEEEETNSNIIESDSVFSTTAKRGRGRPPKTGVPRRGRGRPPKAVIPTRGRGRPKKYSVPRITDLQKGNCSISGVDTSQTKDSDVLIEYEDAISNSSLHEVNEERYDDANKSSGEEAETNSNDIESDSVFSTTAERDRERPPTALVTIRKRGRPAHAGLMNKARGRPANTGIMKRGRGRPRNLNNDSNLNISVTQLFSSSQKRKLVDQDSSGPEADSSDESESGRDDSDQVFPNPVRGRGQGMGKDRGGKTKKDMIPPAEVKCCHCEMVIKSLQDFKIHLMSKHSLMYKPEQPQGIQDPYAIVKNQGFVDCPSCCRRFKNPQYYRHHITWCGRENETYFCPKCNKETKCMWEKQHNRMHAQQEQLREQAEQRKREEWERREQRLKEKEENEEGKMKRKAARSALSMMNSLGEICDEIDSGDEIVISGEDDDEDDDEDQEDETEITADDGEKGAVSKNYISRKLPAKYEKWGDVCTLMGEISISKRLECLRNFYKRVGQGRLFPHLSPIPENLKVLSSRERDNYVPHLKESPLISSIENKSPCADEFTLRFGESKCDQGRGFGYTGGPIWAMEWCPRPLTSVQEQVLAIAVDIHPGHYLYLNKVVGGSNLLQFWSVRRKLESKEKMSQRLDFCIAHDGGHVRSISWCPLGCFDEITSNEKNGNSSQGNVPSTLPRLGLLAVACSDSNILIFSIPQPSSVDSLIPSTSDNHEPIILKPKPCLKLIPNSMNDATPCLSVSWQSDDTCQRIIGGYGRGEVLMWALTSSFVMDSDGVKSVRPIRAFIRHKSAVVACVWSPTLPHLFVSCDYNGVIYLWDSNRPLHPQTSLKKSSHQITKAICMAGPVHWGIFTANDKLMIPGPDCYTNDFYLICFHGFTAQCTTTQDFSTTVAVHTACAWDVTFDPVFNIVVSCDAIGNVRVTLVEEKSLLSISHYKTYTFAHQTFQTMLYKLSSSEDKDTQKKTSSSQARKGGERAEDVMKMSDEQEHLTIKTQPCEESSVSEIKNEGIAFENDPAENVSVTNGVDPKTPVQNKKLHDNWTLCYNEYGQGRGKFEKLGRAEKMKKNADFMEREKYGLFSKMESIQRVRLCPGMDKNVWLASGGNAGVLRLDRLYDLVLPHSRLLVRELDKLMESSQTTDS